MMAQTPEHDAEYADANGGATSPSLRAFSPPLYAEESSAAFMARARARSRARRAFHEPLATRMDAIQKAWKPQVTFYMKFVYIILFLFDHESLVD